MTTLANSLEGGEVERDTTLGTDSADDPYWDYDESECWNCGGEGFVTGCSWDWQCDTYDEGEGTCLCSRPCHICHPPKHNAELRQILGEALRAHTDGETSHV